MIKFFPSGFSGWEFLIEKPSWIENVDEIFGDGQFYGMHRGNLQDNAGKSANN